ncbi:hypothetical protein [Roseateles sp.]|uniref:hypothetical protein n=1 Tax=Roseateles sp. TaxID=1971397 RepID=UPI0039E9CBB7
MRLPNSLHAEGWREQMTAQQRLPARPFASHGADSASPPLHSRQRHALAIIAVVAALGASAGLNLIDDPRPLDVQMSSALRRAGEALKDWQNQLSHGLQVSLRSVADGSEHPPTEAAFVADTAPDTPQAAVLDANDRVQSVQPVGRR